MSYRSTRWPVGDPPSKAPPASAQGKCPRTNACGINDPPKGRRPPPPPAPPKPPSRSWKCGYCGAVHQEDVYTCPSCGAART